jgi:hypothetical protein
MCPQAVDQQWYIAFQRKTYGPLTVAELSKLAADGLITNDTNVWSPGWQNWHPLCDVPGLIDDPSGEEEFADERSAGGAALFWLRHNAKQHLKHHWMFWFWVLLVAIVVCVAIKWGGNTDHFWLWWEAGALIIATIYTIVFYIRLFARRDDDGKRLYKGIEGYISVVPFICLLAIFALLCSTAVSILEVSTYPWFHDFLTWFASSTFLPNTHMVSVMFLVLAALCFCLVDATLLTHCHPKIRHEFSQALVYNGIPVFLAFGTLCIFIGMFDNSSGRSDVLRSFIGGAVAFETLVSNTIFALFFRELKVLSS